MKRIYLLLLTLVLLWPSVSLLGNNLQITNMRIRGQNDAEGYKMIKMDVRWDNSWRTDTYESNWDAVWLFAKYRLLWSPDEWHHVTISTTGHDVPSGATLDVPADQRGAFIYRDAIGSGNVNFEDLQLRWNYLADGLAHTDSVELCVFGIEMVYIPEGSFYVGDGDPSRIGGFVQGTTTNQPFYITSEGPITIGNSNTSQLWARNTNSYSVIAAGDLPADFPKGFQAFYIMKYEITQGQYRDFLNKLTRTQQNNRTDIAGLGNYSTGSNSVPQYRNGIRMASDPGSDLARVFDCDLNSNKLGNEADDGEHIACNYLGYTDILAYADWSGLRPMTELEYEKACRGPLPPYANERAWGNTIVNYATGIVNPGLNNETPTQPIATNIAFGNLPGVTGPYRVGSFAGASTTREQAGATYYGVMEMSGNLYEQVVHVGTTASRNFDGSHGDGELAETGHQNQGWPNAGGGRRGSAFNIAVDYDCDRISGRRFGISAGSRNQGNGGRVVRTAP